MYLYRVSGMFKNLQSDISYFCWSLNRLHKPSQFSYSHNIKALCEFYLPLVDLMSMYIPHITEANVTGIGSSQPRCKKVICVQIEEVDNMLSFSGRRGGATTGCGKNSRVARYFFAIHLQFCFDKHCKYRTRRNIQNPPWILVRQMSVWSLSHEERVWLYCTAATA